MTHFYESLHGWFDYQNFYREVVAHFPSGASLVEIGVYAGRSFAFLGVEMVNAGKEFQLLAVDNYGFISQEQFAFNMQPLAGRYQMACGNSCDLAANYPDESFDFVFIDANHEYPAIRKDILAWLPKIKKGGWISGHDYNLPSSGLRIWGVNQAVDEIFSDNKRLTEGCWVVEIPKGN